MITNLLIERKIAIMQLRQGKTVQDVAQSMNRSTGWVSKWHKRYREEGWQGLRGRSRSPKQPGNKTPPEIKAAICRVRLELEAEAELGKGLKYVGGRAIRTRLKQEKVRPLPSVPTIERVIREAGLTRPKAGPVKEEITYPRLQAKQPHQLTQVDIVPHFLQGGARVACFNSIDVVSRYPTGRAFSHRRSQDAVDFLIHTWQEVGIPDYTQVDNEGCFSGGATHPYVFGKVVRLALQVGTQLLFSPCYHPKSNGFIERFHQDYSYHVWQDTYLDDLAAVNQQGKQFFARYRQRQDHGQLAEQTPHERHHQQPFPKLAPDFQMPTAKLPLRPGRIHFIRRVMPDGTVRVLNVDWLVPDFDRNQGVWVTINLRPSGATLAIFDAAPDVADRHLLADYPVPLKEPIVPLDEATKETMIIWSTRWPQPDQMLQAPTFIRELAQTARGSEFMPVTLLSHSQIPATVAMAKASERLLLATLNHTARLTRRIFSRSSDGY